MDHCLSFCMQMYIEKQQIDYHYLPLDGILVVTCLCCTINSYI